ncbi:MAG: hypothetical protein AMXMBFR84_06290 [Candidatus Hydrogenedentota bacterium]
MQPTVAIIIPAYNAGSTIAACIDACLNQSYPIDDVIVVDDGSTDDTADVSKSFPVTYIYQENGGPAAARNHGSRIADSDIIAFTDSDCIPETDWIEHLVSGFGEGVVGVGGTYTIANPESVLAGLIQAEIEYRHALFETEVDFLGSFNVAYLKSAYDLAGGFDETFKKASGEDNDLAYRLQDNGGILRFIKEARVAHHHPDKMWNYLRTQARHGFWRVKIYVNHPNRRSGDQYAGKAELWAPPAAILELFFYLLVIVSVSVEIAGRAFDLESPIGAFGKLAVLACIVVMLPVSIFFSRVRYRLQRNVMMHNAQNEYKYLGTFWAWPLYFFRDVARGLGLIAGLAYYGTFVRERRS